MLEKLLLLWSLLEILQQNTEAILFLLELEKEQEKETILFLEMKESGVLSKKTALGLWSNE